MSLKENDRLVIKICRLFYEENMSQKDIAQMLSISRPQISRALTYARQAGWVRIHINNPYSKEDTLEQELISAYKLCHSVVVNTGFENENDPQKGVGKSTGMRIAHYITSYRTIGIMSGKSVFHVLDNAILPHDTGLAFVSLVGGMGASGAQWHANYMSQRLAEKTGGKAYLLNAPLLVQNEEVRKTLENEEDIRYIFKRFSDCGIIFAGIGQIDVRATMAESGILNSEDIAYLKKTGAAAVVGGTFIGRNGEILDNELSRRFIGIGVDDLKVCPHVVAVAIGREKISAIDAALRSSLIHELITNTETARGLLKLYQKRASPF